MVVRTLLLYQLTHNRGVTFYFFLPDQRDTIPFFSLQKQASSNREAYSNNTSQIIFLGSVSQLKVLPLARKRSLIEVDENLILCNFAHSLNKTGNLGQNFLRLVKLPLRKQLEILTNTFQIFKVYIKKLEKSQVMFSKRLDFRS